MSMSWFGRQCDEQVLTASWTPQRGVEVEFSDLPDEWLSALPRIGRDLYVLQYGNTIERIDWIAEYDASDGCVLLFSNVTATGRVPSGFGISGAAARVDDDEETIAARNAELTADQVARAGGAWPYRVGVGFMTPQLVDGVAQWTDTDNRYVIGTLSAAVTEHPRETSS